MLWSVSTEDGKRLSNQRLKELPLFDGMIAAHGRLYLVTEKGTVLCYQGQP